jgi:hypothetical protein
MRKIHHIAPRGISRIWMLLIITAVMVSGSVIAYFWLTGGSAEKTNITVTSDSTSGTLIKIDGVEVATPTTFAWTTGSHHVFEAVSNDSDPSVRYIWIGWSDNGNQTHIFNVPAASTTVKASFRTQYYLNVTSPQGTSSLRTSWFDAGTLLTASVKNSTRKSDDIEMICSGWVGTGSVPVSGNDTRVSFTLNKPSSLTWSWIESYRVNFVANPSNYGTIRPLGTGFCCPGLQSISAIPNDGYKFSSWSTVGGLSIAESSSASTTVMVNGSGTVTADFVPDTVPIVISSNPNGSGFVKVDGSLVDTPFSVTWQVGSVHSLEAVAQVAGASGSSRYMWINWSDEGGRIHDFVVPAKPQSVTASYKVQYQVSFSVYPIGNGVINPSGSNWYDFGSAVAVSAAGNSGYVLSSWNSSGSLNKLSNQSSTTSIVSIGGSGAVTANFEMSKVTVTIQSSPAGAGFVKVDGTLQSTPYSFSWEGGSIHTLEALTPVPAGLGMQYVWKSWSDGGAQVNTYRVPSTDAVVEASFKIQYCFTVKTNGLSSAFGYSASIKLNGVRQGTVDDATPFVQWIDGGYSLGSLGVDDPVFAGSGTQEVFVKWVEDESTSNPRSLSVMNSPLNFTAMFQIQYQVAFSVSPVNLGTTSPSGANNWYAQGTVLSINAIVSSSNSFSYWTASDKIAISNSSRSNTVAVINGAGTITANFAKAPTAATVTITSNSSIPPYVRVDGNLYTSPNTFTWNIGDSHTLEAVSPVSDSRVQLVWTSWSDGGAQTHDIVVPNGNTIITAYYSNKQYYLTVDSGGHGNVTGQGWYNAGSTATFSVSPTSVSGANGSRFIFVGWSGTGSGSYNGSATSYTVTLNTNVKEVAVWKTQYQVTFAVSPSSGGTIDPSGTGWYDSGALSISASPASGYKFSFWNGSGSVSFADSLSPQTTASISGQCTLRANFVLKTMHVSSIQGSILNNSGQKAATAIVTIVDPNGNPVSGVAITGSWSGIYSGATTLSTDANGRVTFTTPYQTYIENRTYNFAVTNAALAGWNYDRNANVISSVKITG